MNTETVSTRPLEIDRVLVISTKHLPADIAVSGASKYPDGEARMDSLSSMTGRYGWLVWAGQNTAEEGDRPEPPVPEDDDLAALQVLHAVLTFARSIGCTFVRFDADADAIDALPVFEW